MQLDNAQLAKVEAVNQTAATAYQRARSNGDLSVDARNRLIAKAYIAQRDGLAALEGDTTARDNAEIQRLKDKLTALRPGDDSLSYRDAMSRAEQIASTSDQVSVDLIGLLQRAWSTKDVLLERATLAVVYSLAASTPGLFTDDYAQVINAWIEHNPASEADAERLWDLQRQSGKLATQMATNFIYFAPPPAEIYNMSPSAVAALAAQPTAGA